MPATTICPTLLASTKQVPIANINAKLLNLIINHIEFCKVNNIDIVVSIHVLNTIETLFPWNVTADPKMRQLVARWRAAVITPLHKSRSIISYPPPKCDSITHRYSCNVALDTQLAKAWDSALDELSQCPKVCSLFMKGIVADSSCPSLGRCIEFILVKEMEDWKSLCFPWTLIYPPNLPTTGQRCFVPCKDWQANGPKRGCNHGYIDRKGNEWCMDKLHKDHWDVQTSGGYTCVSFDGRVLR